MVRGVPCMCMAQTPQPVSTASGSMAGSPRKRRHVVDDLGAGMDRVTGHQRLRGVDGDRQVGLPAQRADHRHHAAKFLLHVDRLGVGPGAFAADVEDVGALGGQPQAVLHGRVGVEAVAAVGEAVGRDVDDAHQQRAACPTVSVRVRSFQWSAGWRSEGSMIGSCETASGSLQ